MSPICACKLGTLLSNTYKKDKREGKPVFWRPIKQLMFFFLRSMHNLFDTKSNLSFLNLSCVSLPTLDVIYIEDKCPFL